MRGIALPDKKYFKIGEVADLVGVEPHVLRYWETQFPQVRPHKARSGHRLYRRKDVETLLAIRELLHVQRFTIAGARQALRGHIAAQHGGGAGADNTTLPPGFDPALQAELDALDREPPIVDDEALDADHDEASPSSRAAATTTRPVGAALEVDVVAVDVVGLSSEDLAIEMSRELAAAQGGTIEIVEIVEIEASSASSEGAAVLSAEAPLDRGGRLRRRRNTQQLGFGFQASGKAILEAARTDLRAILAALDRDDVRDRKSVQLFGGHAP